MDLQFGVWQMEAFKCTWRDVEPAMDPTNDLYTLTIPLPTELVSFASYFRFLAKCGQPFRNLAEDLVEFTWNKKTPYKTAISTPRCVIYTKNEALRSIVLLPDQSPPVGLEKHWYANLFAGAGSSKVVFSDYVQYANTRAVALQFFAFLALEGYKAKNQHKLV